MRVRVLARFVVVASLVVPVVHAQQPAAAAAAPSCASSEHRQFDFWIGDWDVANAAGTVVGRNEVTREFGGCVIRERWNVRTPRGGGESLNAYDAATRRWHQTWMDASGNVWKTDGRFENGSMVLARSAPSPQDSTVTLIHRWTWTPTDADRLRQLAEVSNDGGKTWRTTFDGYYSRRRAAGP